MRPRFTYQVTYEKFHEQLGMWVQDGYRTTTDTVRHHASRLKKRAEISRRRKGEEPYGGQVRNVRITKLQG